jgi:hypothetical protein
MDCIDLAQDRDQWRAIVNTLMNLRLPQNIVKLVSRCTIGCVSRRAQLHEFSYARSVILYIACVRSNSMRPHYIGESKVSLLIRTAYGSVMLAVLIAVKEFQNVSYVI